MRPHPHTIPDCCQSQSLCNIIIINCASYPNLSMADRFAWAGQFLGTILISDKLTGKLNLIISTRN